MLAAFTAKAASVPAICRLLHVAIVLWCAHYVFCHDSFLFMGSRDIGGCGMWWRVAAVAGMGPNAAMQVVEKHSVGVQDTLDTVANAKAVVWHVLPYPVRKPNVAATPKCTQSGGMRHGCCRHSLERP